MQLMIVTHPDVDPVYYDEACDQVKPDSDDEAALIDGYIKTATQAAEGRLRRKLITQTIDMRLDAFPCGALKLPYPVQEVGHVQYYDTAGALQTMSAADYWVDIGGIVQRVTPKTSWPAIQCRPQAVKVRMVCGYGGPQDVPRSIRDWILLLVADLHANRGSVNIGNIVNEFNYVDGLLDQHTVPMVA